MCHFSSKSSLLAGVSAVVLAAGVGSGAFAQTVDYTHSTGNGYWGITRDASNTSSTDMAEARDGDHLTLRGGIVYLRHHSGSKEIGVLRSGTGGAGKLEVRLVASPADLTSRIGEIQKQGARAVDLSVQNRGGRLAEVIIAGNAVVHNLEIGLLPTDPSVSRKSRAIFGGDLTIENDVTLNDAGANHRAYLVFNGSGDRNGSNSWRILGTGAAKITAAADGEGTIQVLNGVDNASPGRTTFDIGIGATDKRLRQLTVGDSDKGGGAVFNRGVHVNHIDVIAGSTFDTLKEQGTVRFRGDVSGDAIRLDDEDNGYGIAAVIFDALSGDKTVGLTIDGASASEGYLWVYDSDKGGSDTITFTGKIGNTGKLAGVNIGSVYGGGSAVFKEDVNSTLFRVSGTIGGGWTSQATVEKDLTATLVTIDDGSGSATLTIGGAGRSATVNDAGQTIRGDIRAGRYGRGVLIVDNRGNGTNNNNKVTFTGSVGEAGTGILRQITLSDGRTTFRSGVYARSITINTGDATVFKGHVKAGTGANEGIKLGATSGSVTFDGHAGQTITGDITSASGATGTIIIGNTHADGVTFKGALGTTGAKLNRLTLSDDSEATFEGNVYLANGLKLGDSTITFGGSGDQTIQADITNSTGKRGFVFVNNSGGTVTFEGAVGAAGNDLAIVVVSDGVARFKGDVFAESVGVSSTDGAEFRGNVTTGELGILFAANDDAKITLNGTANQTVTGDITADSGGRGRLVVDNAGDTNNNKVTFRGSVGRDGTALKQITLRDGQTTFDGDVYAGNLTITARDATTFKGHVKADREFELGDGSSVTFGGTAGQTVTGDITGAANGNGTIIIDNVHADGVTFGGQLGMSDTRLNSLTVNEGAKVTFTRPVYLSGTLRLKTGTTLVLGDYLTERDDATRPFVTVGDYAFEGDFTDENRVRLILPLSFTSGTQKVFSAHDTLDKEKFSFAGNNLVRYNYEFSDDGTAVTVTAKVKSVGEVSSKLGVPPSEARMLRTTADFAKDLPAHVKKIFEEAVQPGNEEQGRRLAAQLKPQMTALGGVTTAVVSTGKQVAALLSDRLALQRGGYIRSGFVQSGFATGGGLNRVLWLKPFGSRGKQAKDKKQTIDGYRTSAQGLAMGVDAPVGEQSRVGAALAYSTSRITGKGAGQDKTDVRSWQVSVYGDYSTERYYVEGRAGAGRNDVSTTSRVAVLTRKSAYDTTSLTASVGGGVPINLDVSTTLTPTAGLSWTRVGSANYTTTGALSLNQKIRVESIDAVVGTLGTRIQKDITHGNGTLLPVARVGLSYDFAGDQTTAHGRFTGGGSRFTVKGAKVKKLSGTAGVGLTYAAPRWSIGADYDLSARPGYTGHSVRLDAMFKF